MSSNNEDAETAQLVRTMRQHSGLPLRQLSWVVKTSAAALVDYEHGRHEAKISTLRRIADATNCDLIIEVRPRTT